MIEQSLCLRIGGTERWVTMSCEWLTVKEAAKIVKVTKSTVHRWIRKGNLKYYYTPGGTIRICKEDLLREPEPLVRGST